MSRFIDKISLLYARFFNALECMTRGWFIGLFARLVFASTLLVFFWNSALIKTGDGFFGFLSPSVGAYGQILPKAFESVGADVSALGFHHYVIVLFGTWAEFVLPALIVIGLFTRLASLGFIGFIAVMTFVDIQHHGVDATTIGVFFDRNPSDLIADQRLFWIFLLSILVVKGAGAISLDALLKRRFCPR